MPGFGATWPGNAQPQQQLRTNPGGTKGMQLTPLPATATQASNRPLTFPPQPQNKTGQYEDGPMDRPVRNDPSHPILKPPMIACLVAWFNEAPIIVDGQKVTALTNLGTQISSASSGFCKQMTLKVHPLDRLLELESTGGSAIPYLGFVKVNLQIPYIKGYNEDVLLLVIPTTTYSKKVPVMVGSKIIDRVMGMIIKVELARATMT